MFPVMAIAVAIAAIIRGYRRGLTGQVTSVFGLAFGVICAHIFLEGASDIAAAIISRDHLEEGGRFLTENIAAAVIFFAVYGVFRCITGLVRAALKGLGSSLLDSIIGAAFCLFNYMLMLSMLFNVAVGWNPRSVLMHDGRSSDGNIVALVLALAPPVLGAETFDEFAHEQQLRDARKISRNTPAAADVITTDAIVTCLTVSDGAVTYDNTSEVVARQQAIHITSC